MLPEAEVQSPAQLPHGPNTRVPGRQDCRANDLGRRSPAWRYNTETELEMARTAGSRVRAVPANASSFHRSCIRISSHGTSHIDECVGTSRG